MENGHMDTEQALYKELATIKGFKKEVKALKTRLTKVSNSIEQVQVMDFQEQLCDREIMVYFIQAHQALIDCADSGKMLEITNGFGDNVNKLLQVHGFPEIRPVDII